MPVTKKESKELSLIDKMVAADRPAGDIIKDLKRKSIIVPDWTDIEKEYNPMMHPVMDKVAYPDKNKRGTTEFVTRIALALQRLASRRMTELCFGIPVKRIYRPDKNNEQQVKVSQLMEKIFQRNRIDSMNIERGRMLFAGCEVATLWYATESPNAIYGEQTDLKLRCRNYSPMNGDKLWPRFDDADDMIAMSIEYTRIEGDITVTYFDTFTDKWHIRWRTDGTAQPAEDIREPITLEKISLAYAWRPQPIWEDTSNNVYEIEWSVSRNGNYIRKNSKPIFAIYTSAEKLATGEKKDDDRIVQKYPENSKAEYITWEQATESLKFQVETLTQLYFTQLQLPDMSYENMKSAPMSGEARKMMFIDCQLKVMDESGRLLEFLDREVNVVRAHMKMMFPKYKAAIDALTVENVITPFQISDFKERVESLTTATGGKAIISQEQAVRELGLVDDVEAEMALITADSTADVMQPTI